MVYSLFPKLFHVINCLGEDIKKTNKKNQMYFDSYCTSVAELCLE